MSRIIDGILEYPFTFVWLLIISASLISMVIESNKKRKNRK
jgi:hypothetical protein